MENTNVNTTVENQKEPRGKAIFNMSIARTLLKDYGHPIIDIKPRRDAGPDAWLPFFLDSLSLRDDLQKIVKERRKARTNRAKAEEEIQEPTIEQED